MHFIVYLYIENFAFNFGFLKNCKVEIREENYLRVISFL